MYFGTDYSCTVSQENVSANLNSLQHHNGAFCKLPPFSPGFLSSLGTTPNLSPRSTSISSTTSSGEFPCILSSIQSEPPPPLYFEVNVLETTLRQSNIQCRGKPWTAVSGPNSSRKKKNGDSNLLAFSMEVHWRSCRKYTISRTYEEVNELLSLCQEKGWISESKKLPKLSLCMQIGSAPRYDSSTLQSCPSLKSVCSSAYSMNSPIGGRHAKGRARSAWGNQARRVTINSDSCSSISSTNSLEYCRNSMASFFQELWDEYPNLQEHTEVQKFWWEPLHAAGSLENLLEHNNPEEGDAQ